MLVNSTFSVVKTDKFDAEQNTHKRLDPLTKGGLWKINPNVERIFTITELYFQSVTGKSGVLKIDKEDIVTNISNIVSIFQTWVSSAVIKGEC